MRSIVLLSACVPLTILSGCFSPSSYLQVDSSEHVNNKTKFSSKDYGVKASPRVTTARNVRKGGGRRQVGKPYQVKGKWYTPRAEPGYDRTGQASWYGPNFHGRLTANGEVYDQYALSGAHPTFPLPSYARVTNVANGKSVVVRVNDRGPYHEGRVIDMSGKAAEMLDYKSRGIATVRVQYIGPAPLDGLDAQYLAGTYRQFDQNSVASVASNAPQPLPVVRSSRVDTSKLDELSTSSVGNVARNKPKTFVSWVKALSK